jgi:hypothetical protein
MEAQDMAQIPCSWCGFNLRVITQTVNPPSSLPDALNWLYKDVLRCVLTCGKCEKKTVFQLEGGYGLTYLPGKDILVELNLKAPADSQEMYEQARLCFFGAAYRAAAVMGRACLEQALVGKGFVTGKLEEKIDEAKKKGILGNREYALAHGSRLVGNDSIHEAKDITQAHLLAALAAGATVVNHLWPK